MNQPDDWNDSRFYTTCSACGARYHRSEGVCCDEAEEEEEEDNVPIGKILVTAKLIVTLIRYGLLPDEWRSKWKQSKDKKLTSRQMAHIDPEDFGTLFNALQPIIDGEREVEHNQMRYIRSVYETLERALSQ